VAGWAFAISSVSEIEVLVDGMVAGSATYGINLPGFSSSFPEHSEDTGFRFLLDTTRFSNGAHELLLRISDASGKIAILPPAQVNIVNP